MRLLSFITNLNTLPKHIAFIMDGNRRYASMLNKTHIEGHGAGFSTLENVLEMCLLIGIECVSVYAFRCDIL